MKKLTDFEKEIITNALSNYSGIGWQFTHPDGIPNSFTPEERKAIETYFGCVLDLFCVFSNDVHKIKGKMYDADPLQKILNKIRFFIRDLHFDHWEGKKKAIKMHKEGVSVVEIENVIGVSEDVIKDWLKEEKD